MCGLKDCLDELGLKCCVEGEGSVWIVLVSRGLGVVVVYCVNCFKGLNCLFLVFFLVCNFIYENKSLKWVVIKKCEYNDLDLFLSFRKKGVECVWWEESDVRGGVKGKRFLESFCFF